MSSDEIRLWRWPDGGFRPKGADADPQYIALPAARHAALMRVVEALEGLMAVQNGPPLVREEDEWRAAMDEAEAALNATAPGRQGEAPR